MRHWFSLMLIGLLGVSVAAAQTTTQSVTLYAGPGTTYEEVGTLGAEQPFTVRARSRMGNWVRIESSDSAGWTMTGDLPLAYSDFKLSNIPAINMPDADMAHADVQLAPTILYETPVLPHRIDADFLRDVYERGQANGNDPHAVVKIGDCNTASGLFLTPFSTGTYDLGPYDYLRDVTHAYADSFGRRSLASRDGFNASSIFDPLWAMSDDCNPNEPPLLCEFRNNPASVAFIMFGQNDIFTLSRDQYRDYLSDIVAHSLDLGVIPVLSTFTNRPEFEDKWGQIMALNVITIEVANEYNVPLINFWLAAQPLPGYGIGGDFAHLTAGGEGITFDGRETQYGLTLYNLAVLNMLDVIYHDVINE